MEIILENKIKLNSDQIIGIMDQQQYLINYIENINYSGGEPLLYPYLTELIEFNSNHQIKSHITTKGGQNINLIKNA